MDFETRRPGRDRSRDRRGDRARGRLPAGRDGRRRPRRCADRRAALASEQPRLERLLAVGRDPVAARALALADDLAQLGALEVERRVVVGRVAGRRGRRRGRAACRSAAAPARRRSGGRSFPASRPRPPPSARSSGPNESVTESSNQQFAPALQPPRTRAALPGLAQRPVDPVDAPDREHVRRVAAVDVDHVLLRRRAPQALGHPEELQMARLARATAKRVVEALDALAAVGRGRGRGSRRAGAATPASSSRSSSSFEPGLRTPPPPMARMWPLTLGECRFPADALRLRLRRGLRRRRARAARRQGDRARRDDRARRPRPGGLHDHDRRVPRVHGRRRRAAGRARGRGGASTSPRSRARRASASATRTIRCSSPSARAPPSRCRG